jgi:hypothetical protein
MQSSVERRQFTRVVLQIEGEICIDDAATISGVSRDVSLNGLFLMCEPSLPVGTNCRVTLFLGDRGMPSRVEAYGRIVRLDDVGIGLTFTEIMGLESFEHLRNLVLYNSSPDTTRIEEEFDRHYGVKPRCASVLY